MERSPNKALILLGMHRSGTSVLAGCLHLLGVNLGRFLLPSDKANPAGYFENRDIVLLHDILLRDLGCRWDMVGPLPNGWLESPAAAKCKERISALIDRDFSAGHLWAIKDPRLCRLAPLWLDVLQYKGIEPCFVLIVRHPLEVAKSLEKRNGFDLLKGHLLWLAHNREALAACRDYKPFITTYDAFLADPVHCIENISRGTGVCLEPAKIHQKIIHFVRPDLKHQSSDAHREYENPPFSHYAQLYEQVILQHGTDSFGSPSLEMLGKGLGLNAFPIIVKDDDHIKHMEATRFSEILDDFLEMIGRYERSELDRETQRERLLLAADQRGGPLYARVYFPVAEDGEDYPKGRSKKVLLAHNEWEKVSVLLPNSGALRQKRLRLSPLNTKGLVSISAINIVDAATGEIIWSAADDVGFQQCKVEGDSFPLSMESTLQICATGANPRILLPAIPDLPDAAILLEIWIKVSRDLSEIKQKWKEMEKQLTETKQHLQQKEALTREYFHALAETERRQAERIKKTYESLPVEDLPATSSEDNIKLLKQWTRRLHRELKFLRRSRKWEIGNRIIRILTLGRSKPRMNPAMDRLGDMLQQLETRSFEQERDINELIMQIQNIQREFNALAHSLRWRIGHVVVNTAKLSFLKKNPQSASDRIRDILNRFDEWQGRSNR